MKLSYVRHPKYAVFKLIHITKYLCYSNSNPPFRNQEAFAYILAQHSVLCSPSPNTTKYLRRVRFIIKKTFLVCTVDQSMLQNVSLNGYGIQQFAVQIFECLHKFWTDFIKATLLTSSLYTSCKKWERREAGGSKTYLPLLGGELVWLP